MTKKEQLEFCKSYLQTLQKDAKIFWSVYHQDFIPQTEPSQSSIELNDQERIARIADKFGFDGAIIRKSLFEDDGTLSVNSHKLLQQKINILPKLIAAIEEYSEPVTIPDDAELLSVSQVAIMLGWGESVVRQRDREGLLPLAIRNGGTIQWNRQELKNWIDAKCPPRQKWEQLKQGKGV